MKNQKQILRTLTLLITLLVILIVGYFSWRKLKKLSQKKTTYKEDENFFRKSHLDLINEEKNKEENKEKVDEVSEEDNKKTTETKKKRAELIDNISLDVAEAILDEGFVSLNVHTKPKDPETSLRWAFVRLEVAEYEGYGSDPGGIQVLLDFRIPKGAYPRFTKFSRGITPIPNEFDFVKTLLGERKKSDNGEIIEVSGGWKERFEERLKFFVSDDLKLIYNPGKSPRKVLLLEVTFTEQCNGKSIKRSETIECPRSLWENNIFADRQVTDKDVNPNSEKGLYFNIMRILEKDRNNEGISIDDIYLSNRDIKDLKIVGAYFSIRFTYFWQRSERNISGINMEQLMDLLHTIFTDENFSVSVGEYKFRWTKLALIDPYTNWTDEECKECAFREPVEDDSEDYLNSEPYF